MLASFRCEPSTEVCNRLLSRVADRDRYAFRSLYRRLFRRVFRQACDGLGDTAAAVSVTKAVFVEVWRLAPVSAARHDDAIGWLTAITARRTAERVAAGSAWPGAYGHDQHTHHELAAALEVDRAVLP